jgi:hypothetical protein
MKQIIIGIVVFILSGLASTRASKRINTHFHPGAGMHNILSSKLPSVLLADIKKEYKDYWITELYEEGKVKRPSYSITLENADEIIKLSSDGSSNWIMKSTTIKTN